MTGDKPTCTQNFVYKKAPALTKSEGIGGISPRKRHLLACFGLPSSTIGAVWVARSRAGYMLHVQPPTTGANVVKLSGASHPAHVILAIWGALVRQNHQPDFVKGRQVGSCSAFFLFAIAAPPVFVLYSPTYSSIPPSWLKGKHDLTFFAF